MFCRNCGKIINKDSNFCPYCQTRLKQIIATKKNPFEIVSIISLVMAVIAFHEAIMIIAIIIGIIGLTGGIILKMKDSTHRLAKTIIFSICGIITNVCWLLFVLYII